MATAPLDAKRLAIYLNDHLTIATAGVEVARRTLGSNGGTPYEAGLRRAADALEQDRRLLTTLMGRLGVRVDPVKVAAGWIGEKLGRLKLNGSLTSYSPLSRVVELEGIELVLTSLRAMWAGLDRVLGDDERAAGLELALGAARALERIDEVAELRLRAVEEALAVS